MANSTPQRLTAAELGSQHGNDQETAEMIRLTGISTLEFDFFEAVKHSVPPVIRYFKYGPLSGSIFVGPAEESEELARDTWAHRMMKTNEDTRACYIWFTVKTDGDYIRSSKLSTVKQHEFLPASCALSEYEKEHAEFVIAASSIYGHAIFALVPTCVFAKTDFIITDIASYYPYIVARDDLPEAMKRVVGASRGR